MEKGFLRKLLRLTGNASTSGGLEISDSTLRFVYFDGRLWQLVSQRLPAGVMEAGRVKNKEQLSQAVRSLGTSITSRGGALSHTYGRKKTNVIISMSSLSVYTQVFTLPKLDKSKLNEVVALNLQMVSPMPIERVYAGWQVLRDDTSGHLEILSAFVDRGIIDEITEILNGGGFGVASVEFRALSLSRLARERGVGFDPNESSVILSLDDSGIDFLVMRHGQLYFDYFTAWHNVQGEGRQISKSEFEKVIVRSLNQVFNFSLQHFHDSVKTVFVAASSLSGDVEKMIKENFSVSLKQLTLETDRPLASDWFIALGSGLRGLLPASEDSEITLVSEKARNEFHEGRFLEFLRFWQILFATSLGILLAAFLVVDLFTINMKASLESKTPLAMSADDQAAYAAIKDRVLQFNRSVASIGLIRQTTYAQSAFLSKMKSLATSKNIELKQLTLQSFNSPAKFSGKAQSSQDVLDFKSLLVSDPQFQNIDLRLQDIKGGDFSLSFSLNP